MVKNMVSNKEKYEECVLCGESFLIDYGYKISWGIKELNNEDLSDERFFCTLECMRRWILELSRNGTEELAYTIESDISNPI
jgi:hypothetical protein